MNYTEVLTRHILFEKTYSEIFNGYWTQYLNDMGEVVKIKVHNKKFVEIIQKNFNATHPNVKWILP